jgi:hypothetical protein
LDTENTEKNQRTPRNPMLIFLVHPAFVWVDHSRSGVTLATLSSPFKGEVGRRIGDVRVPRPHPSPPLEGEGMHRRRAVTHREV